MPVFPSHLVPNSEKNEEWIKRYIKAAWDDYGYAYPDAFYNARDRYHETKLYMLGKQSISKYKKLVDPQGAANRDGSYINLDYSVLPIVPKFRRIALGKLQKSSYNVEAEAIDPHAVDEKNRYFADLQARMMMRDEMEKQGMGTDLIQFAPNEPKDEKELEIFKEYGYKHVMASEMEMAIDLVLQQNEYDMLRKEILADIFDYGIGAYREYVCKETGRIKLRYVNPVQLVMSYVKKEDCSDAQYIGEVQEMTISDLKAEAGDQISQEQYEQIYAKFATDTQLNPNNYRDFHYLDNQKIKVLDIEFFSTNDYTVEERTNNRGNKVYGRANGKRRSKKNKYHSKAYKVVYKGKWVINTDAFYDVGLMTDMKRDKNNLSDTTLNFHVIAPDIYQSITYSLGEQMKPIADAIQIAWLKLQNVIIRAKPRGIQIEITSLENVPIGKGGEALKPLEIVDMYNQTGNLVYRAIDEVGMGSPAKPIQELNNGLGDEAQRYFQHIQSLIQTLRDITGFNELSDASTPDPRTLKSVAQSAQESTNNALAYIGMGERRLAKNLFTALACRVSSLARRGKLSGYVQALGTQSIEFIKVSSKVSLHTYGIFIRDEPDEEERQVLNERVNLSLTNQQITVADAFVVDNTPNLKQAEAILAHRIEVNRNRAMEESKRQQEQNAQLQTQAAQAAEQAKQQTLQVQLQTDTAKIQAETQKELAVLDRKYQYEMQLEQMRTGGKIEQSKIEGESRVNVQEMRNSGEINKEQIRQQPEVGEQMPVTTGTEETLDTQPLEAEVVDNTAQ